MDAATSGGEVGVLLAVPQREQQPHPLLHSRAPPATHRAPVERAQIDHAKSADSFSASFCGGCPASFVAILRFRHSSAAKLSYQRAVIAAAPGAAGVAAGGGSDSALRHARMASGDAQPLRLQKWSAALATSQHGGAATRLARAPFAVGDLLERRRDGVRPEGLGVAATRGVHPRGGERGKLRGLHLRVPHEVQGG